MTRSTTLMAVLLALPLLSGPVLAENALLLSDESRSDGTSFAEQMRSAPAGRIVLVNTFQVPDEEAEAFGAGWAKAAEVLRRQPGFISASMHRPVGSSRLWVNYAVWESAAALAAALSAPEFRAAAANMKNPGFRRLYQAGPVLGPVR